MGVNPDFKDLFSELYARDARQVYEALSKFGAPMESLVAEDLAAPGTIFQIGIEPNRIDIITSLKLPMLFYLQFNGIVLGVKGIWSFYWRSDESDERIR